jgi:hypothetical protein
MAALQGYLAATSDQFCDAQVQIATAALKWNHQELYPSDTVYGQTPFWRLHSPIFQGVMEMTLSPLGYADPLAPFRLLAVVVTALYLLGMYALLYQQCRSWSVAALVSLVSSAIVFTLGRSCWGVGSLQSITPEGIILAMSPLILLAYIRYETQWRLALAFGFIGLMGNLHLMMAVNLAFVLLLVYMARRRFSLSALPMAIACAGAAALAAAPCAVYYLGLRWTIASGGPVDFDTVYRIFRFGGREWSYVFYPRLWESLLTWMLVAGILIILDCGVLVRAERFKSRNVSLWVILAAAAMLVAMGGQAIIQAYAKFVGKAPPVIDFYRAAAIVMLPLYVLLAQSLTNLFRLIRTHRQWLQWSCAAFAIVWLAPSDNFAPLRQKILDLATSFVAESDKPAALQHRQARRAEMMEMRAIADWARAIDKDGKPNTDPAAVFICDIRDSADSQFRMYSRRSIVAAGEDMSYLFYLSPDRLDAWSQTKLRQSRLVPPSPQKVNLDQVDKFIDLLRDMPDRPDYQQVRNWYAIFPADAAPPDAQPVHAPANAWGNMFQVYHFVRQSPTPESGPCQPAPPTPRVD